MRLWWPWRRYANPGTGRDPAGRLYDGDTVRLPGQARWADLLAPSSAPAAGALDEHTAVLPIITRAARARGWGDR